MSFYQPHLLVYGMKHLLPIGLTAIQYFYISLFYTENKFVVKLLLNMKDSLVFLTKSDYWKLYILGVGACLIHFHLCLVLS